MHAEDSGGMPLTRDGGFKMIQTELAVFEDKRLVPAINSLKLMIASNDDKTDNSTEAINQLRGAIKGLAAFNAILGVIWIVIQIHERTVSH
jgi:hypothetical protein